MQDYLPEPQQEHYQPPYQPPYPPQRRHPQYYQPSPPQWWSQTQRPVRTGFKIAALLVCAVGIAFAMVGGSYATLAGILILIAFVLIFFI